jgi:hypothetical protein
MISFKPPKYLVSYYLSIVAATVTLGVSQAIRPRKVAGRPAHVTKAPPLFPKVVVVAVKESSGGEKGERGR